MDPREKPGTPGKSGLPMTLPQGGKRSFSKEQANNHFNVNDMSVEDISSSRPSRRPSYQNTTPIRSTSLDVPSLANLNLASVQAQAMAACSEAQGEDGFQRQVSGNAQRRNSYRKRLKAQDTFGVQNVRSIGDDDEEDPSDLDWALAMLGPTILVVLLYGAAVCVWEFKYFIPYDSGFAIVLLWCGSMIGGQLALAIGLPPLLGMLCSGILWKNCGDLVRGLPEEWGAAIRAFGLMNILMRGGLEMDLKAVRRLGPAAMRLTVMPGVTEALTVSGVACLMFKGMPWPLALALGFILGAVSPAVVVGGMFDLQARGYGVKKGVPSLVVAAASFDDVVAISGFSMCIGLAVGHGNIVVEALHGPVNIIAGIGCGLGGALLACMTKIWNRTWKRSAVVLVLGVIFTFLATYLHYAGAGALASLVMAAVSSQFWQRGFGGKFSTGPDDHFPHEVEMDLAKIWRTLAEPLLFSVIGAALDFHKLDFSMIPKGVLVVISGVVLRTTAAYFATFGAGLCFKERLFIALAWMPKATVQAALGSLPLNLIEAKKFDNKEEREEMLEFGQAILTTAVFSILITAPIGLIVIQQLGPRWLEHGFSETEENLARQISEETPEDLAEKQPSGASISEGDVGAGMGKKGGGVAKKGPNFASVMPMNDLCLVEVDGTGDDHPPAGQPPELKHGWQDK